MEPVKEENLRYPLSAWLFCLSGTLIGAFYHGFDKWQSYVLGLPFLLIGAIISGLITGKVIYPAAPYKGLFCSYRKDDPSGFWLAILIMGCLSTWLIFEFLDYVK